MFNEDQAAKMLINCNEGKKAISYCFVFKYYFCSSCKRAHRRLRVTRDHRNVLLEKDLLQLLKEPVMCEKEGHDGEDLLYYCDDFNESDECICHICRDDMM